MKKITLVLSLLCSIFSFSQTKDTVYKKYEDINDLKSQFKSIDVEAWIYKDETFSYEVEIPEWLEIENVMKNALLQFLFDLKSDSASLQSDFGTLEVKAKQNC